LWKTACFPAGETRGNTPFQVREGIIDVCIANDPYSTAKCGRAGRILLGFRLWKVH
jgi:hypothetical protein